MPWTMWPDGIGGSVWVSVTFLRPDGQWFRSNERMRFIVRWSEGIRWHHIYGYD
jgi:hypothetical protein